MRTLIVAGLVIAPLAHAWAATGPVAWISKKPTGTATADANAGAVSADGQWAAFSTDDPLLPGDQNGQRDVYLKDLSSGALTLVSHAAGQATGGNGASDVGSDPNNYQGIDLSVDGRFVVYESQATNLVTGVTDANNGDDVFRFDRATGANAVVSLKDPSHTRDLPSVNPHTSGDGQLVVFGSGLKVWVRDMPSGTTTRVDVARTGGEPDNFAERPDISADGRFVVFLSPASDLVADDGNLIADVFRRDLIAAQTVRTNLADDETPANDSANHPHISGDGSKIVFESSADNLVGTGEDTNLAADGFLRDLSAGTTTRISVEDDGGQSSLGGRRPDLSADGTRVSFDTTKDQLGDPALSNLGVQDVYVRDRAAGRTFLASVAPPGVTPIDADAELATMAGSGRFVVFRTRTALLDPADSGAVQDIYVKDLGPGSDVTAPTVDFDGLVAVVGADPSGVAMVLVDGQIMRLPADRRLLPGAGQSIEVWDGAGNRQAVTAPRIGVSIGGTKLRRKRLQLTFTITTAAADGTIEIRRIRKRGEKIVATQNFTQSVGEQVVTVPKRLPAGRYVVTLVAAGETVTASFRVR